MAYTTEEKIENYLLIDIDSTFSTQIDNWITSAEQYIDNYCQRTFSDEGAATKTYDGNGTSELLVDDIYSLSKIEIEDNDGNIQWTVDTEGDYYLYPSNETPKLKIELDPTNTPYFQRGQQNIKIKASWGYQSVPSDIQLAATKLVAGIIEDKNESEAGKVDSESIGDYKISYKDLSGAAEEMDVKSILQKYRKPII